MLLQVALQEQRHDNNAAAARQLKLIERLRADKDALSAKCLAAASEQKVDNGSSVAVLCLCVNPHVSAWCQCLHPSLPAHVRIGLATRLMYLHPAHSS